MGLLDRGEFPRVLYHHTTKYFHPRRVRFRIFGIVNTARTRKMKCAMSPGGHFVPIMYPSRIKVSVGVIAFDLAGFDLRVIPGLKLAPTLVDGTSVAVGILRLSRGAGLQRT